MIFWMRSRSRRSQVFRHGFVLVCLGFVATVLAAWVSAWAAPSRVSALGIGYGAGQSWGVQVPKSWPANPKSATYIGAATGIIGVNGPQIPPAGVRYRVREGLHTGVSVSLGSVATFFNGEDPRYATDAVYVGWPLRSMAHRGPTDARPLPKNSVFHFVYNGISVPEISWLGLQAGRHLPIQPILWPFILSSIGYAFAIEIALQLYLLRGRLRKRRWRKNGDCLTCGYVVEELAVCPECGVEVDGIV